MEGSTDHEALAMVAGQRAPASTARRLFAPGGRLALMGFSRTRDPKQAAFLWSIAFLHAVRDAHGLGPDPEEHLHAEFAAAHALLDLRNVLRAIDWGLRGLPENHPVHARVRMFRDAFPDIVEARDALEHFDEYATGRGRRQRGNEEPEGWQFAVDRPTPEHVIVRLGPYTIDLTALREEVPDLVAHVSAATDPAPTEGNIYAPWFRQQGYALTPVAMDERGPDSSA